MTICLLRRAAPWLAVLMATVPAPAPAQARSSGTRNGFAPDRLARIDSMLDGAVRQGEIGGLVAFVLRDDQIVYERAVGWRDREAQVPMTTNTVFRIASQTKALTSAAILMLMEEGRLSLATPASRFLPTFARTTVAQRTDTGVVVVPARRAITIRDLLTHSAGVSYGGEAHLAEQYRAKGLGPAAGFGWYTADKTVPICETMETLGTLPFAAQPGERFVYGYNTDLLGCIVERVSGVSLDRFLRERLTGPLGMRDTHFFLPVADRARLATVYRSDSGRVVRADTGARGQGHYVDGPRVSYAGGAGLVSTARDYARFLQMIAHGGTWNGRRYMAPHTVALMTTNQLGALYGTGTGTGFGLGFETVEQYGATGMASRGTYGWGGAYGSNYKVDPVEGLVIVVMMNQLPNTSDVVARFQTMVYAALVESRAAGAR
ncbi:serine hydrolase domain-containing protein [Gemmatimonas sp.]|uniref:serine hydrolase domain-containing protein n=1 Tax=Gemmatimonas sp. TaxID=1962908 RepID=UPI0025C0198E|nr:serine hydrolase domain-containing protein [Gemmatimonas sp.]MCA2989424.1 beta-lactamase family protein [Gemmatimonas sp.]